MISMVLQRRLRFFHPKTLVVVLGISFLLVISASYGYTASRQEKNNVAKGESSACIKDLAGKQMRIKDCKRTKKAALRKLRTQISPLNQQDSVGSYTDPTRHVNQEQKATSDGMDSNVVQPTGLIEAADIALTFMGNAAELKEARKVALSFIGNAIELKEAKGVALTFKGSASADQ